MYCKGLREKLGPLLPGIETLFDEPMSAHTSFEVGGPADVMLVPGSMEELATCLEVCRTLDCRPFLLGGGTNLLVSDRGVRGIVVKLGGLNTVHIKGNRLIAEAGATVEKVCQKAEAASLSGVEFLYGMPGTIGGALWMNARCYGGEISDCFVQAEVLTADGALQVVPYSENDFAYKKSPFQQIDGCIISVELELVPGIGGHIREKMESNRSDRKQKGHYRAPSAGSLFKNDRSFGAPTGQILDDLGLKGHVSGGASIASFHGNIFINNGTACAGDILDLIILAFETARKERNILLEPEVRLVGDWAPGELAPLAEVL